MRKTYWWCRNCQKRGSVEMERNIDAWSGVFKIHEAHVTYSPECPERYYIRVATDEAGLEAVITQEMLVLSTLGDRN